MTATITCRTCQKSGDPLDTQSWHPFRHPINTGNLMGAAALGNKKPPPQQVVRPSSGPFDPVLRQALINKGVITPEDLRDAEAMIQAVTQSMGGMDGSNSPATRG